MSHAVTLQSIKMTFHDFTVAEVKSIVKRRSKKKTAPAPSLLDDKDIAKLCNQAGYETLTNLVNAMVQFGEIPNDLSTSTICLLFKDPTGTKGKDPNHIKSWRPIQLQEMVWKVMAALIDGRIRIYVDENASLKYRSLPTGLPIGWLHTSTYCHPK